MESATISVDEFQALEQKVLQTVELIKREREARVAMEAERDAALVEVQALREQMQGANAAHSELQGLRREREAVRQRVEKMLAQMDELF